MKVKIISVPTNPTSLFDLSGAAHQHVSGIVFQAPEANAETVYFGDRSNQPFELRPKANGTLSIADTTSVFIRGTSGDKLLLGLM